MQDMVWYLFTCLHVSARQVVIGHVEFKGKGPFFRTPHSPHQPSDHHQTWYIWLPRPYHQPCQFWLRSDRRGRLGKGVKYTLFTFSPFFLFQTLYLPVNMVRFWSLIRQTLCSRAYMNLQLRLLTSNQFWGVIDPKNPQFRQNRNCLWLAW